jgi:hypothetical protein
MPPTYPPSALLKDLFNALPDSATGGDQSMDYYVNRATDPELDAVANLLQFIDWSPASQDTYLFTGLRGAGKTTELNRLVKELREQGIAAYYCDASIYLNLNDPLLSLPELLMAALAGLADAVKRELGTDFLADSIWQRTQRLLRSNVEIKPTAKLGLDGAGMEIEATLRENPDFRKALNHFAQDSSRFYDEAQAFAREVTDLVRSKTQSTKIVLVVDSLERLSAPTGEEAALFDSLKQVFFNDPQRLRLPGFSVVYSAPPYLPAVLPAVGSGFSQCVSLPNFKVMQRPALGAEPMRNPQGIEQMLRILSQRFPRWHEVLATDVLQELAWLSGGNVRRYFSLVRAVARKAALSHTPLPITDIDATPVQHAISEATQPLQWLNAEDRRWLERFSQDSRGAAQHIGNLKEDLPPIIRLFDHSLVLDYRNGETWFQVPPLVRQHLVR